MSKKPPVSKHKQEASDTDNILVEEPIDTAPELKQRAILLLSGPINEDHLQLVNQLLELHYTPSFNEEIQLLINSPGGDASVGWSIIDVMNFIRLPIHTIALGYVCSMGADIFVNGDKRTMGEHSTLMIHPHSTMNYGNHHQLLAAAKGDQIEHFRRLNHYRNNSKYSTVEEVQKNLFSTPGDDLYLTPEECLKHGLCDEIAASNKAKRSKPHYLQITSMTRDLLSEKTIKTKSKSKKHK